MVTETLKQHVANQDMPLIVEQIPNHRSNDKGKHWELLVKWQGFEDMEYSWEPIKYIVRDVPTMLKIYIMGSSDLKFKAKNSLKSIFEGGVVLVSSIAYNGLKLFENCVDEVARS